MGPIKTVFNLWRQPKRKALVWRPQIKSASWNTGSAGITPSFISFILIFRSRNPSSPVLVFVTLACDENTILRYVSCNFCQSGRSIISLCPGFCPASICHWQLCWNFFKNIMNNLFTSLAFTLNGLWPSYKYYLWSY